MEESAARTIVCKTYAEIENCQRGIVKSGMLCDLVKLKQEPCALKVVADPYSVAGSARLVHPIVSACFEQAMMPAVVHVLEH